MERRSNRNYYYRKRWENGRVISEYVGGGAIAQIASIRDEIERERTAAQRAERDAKIEEDRQSDSEIIALMAEVKVISDAFMLASGYRQSKRIWRRNNMADIELGTTEVEPQEKYSIADLRRLMAKVNCEKPAADDIDELRKCFKYRPKAVVQILGIAAAVRRKQFESISNQTSMQVAMEIEVDEIRKGFEGAESSPLEQIHIEVIIGAWLRLKHLEMMLEMQESDHWQVHYEKRVTAAQSRLLRATESLTRVRRAMHGLPMIGQLNVAMPGALQQNNTK